MQLQKKLAPRTAVSIAHGIGWVGREFTIKMTEDIISETAVAKII